MNKKEILDEIEKITNEILSKNLCDCEYHFLKGQRYMLRIILEKTYEV